MTKSELKQLIIRYVLGKQVPDLAAWYIVNSAPSDRVFTAYIGK